MKRAEVVLVPTPGMGHLLAAGKLAKLIVQRHVGISVVVLIISEPHGSTSINAYVDSQSRDDEVDPARLAFLALPGPPPPTDPATAPDNFMAILELHKPIVKRAVLDRVGSGSSKLAGFILDMFCATMIDVANELNVPSYVFFPSGAYGLNLFCRFRSLADDDGVNIAEEFGDDPDKELDVPGYRNRVPGKVLPAVVLDKEGGSEMMVTHSRRLREARGVLVNTYTELESYAIQALQKQAEDHQIPAVYPVGPTLELDDKRRAGFQKEEHDSIMEWLDRHPPSSVVFLCFGSMGSFDDVQVREIATGLDRAGHRFLWSLCKPPADGKPGIPTQHDTFKDALPDGFLERTARRGKIIGWAPQAAILAHRAIGGFVSHCGWNSILESLWFGVPLATWPLYAEQQLNAFVLVKELGVAVEIKMDYQRDPKTNQGNFLLTAEEIEARVKELMSMDEEMKNKVRELSDKGKKALQDGGSSHNWLGRFIADVLDNVA